MPFSTYAELKTAISDHTKRTDFTAAQLTDFVRLAEDALILELKTAEQETVATISVSAETASVPSGFKSALSFKVTDAEQERVLRYEPLDRLESRYPESGTPVRYTRRGSVFVFHPVPTSAVATRLTYMAKLANLSDSVTTNWLLDAYPSVYLWASLEQAYLDVKDEARSMQHGARWREQVARINRDFAEEIDQGLVMPPSSGSVI